MKKIQYRDSDGNTVYGWINDMGMMVNVTTITPEIKTMLSPVICAHCGTAYDLADGKVVHNYGDCTMFRTPCCDVLVDDRNYKSFPDFTRLEKTLYTD